MKDEIIIYQANQASLQIEVRIEEESVWLSQSQMATLFNQTKQNISLHINNCFKEKELESISVVKDFLTTAKDGKNYTVKYYNLDVIISVGYRVKSKQGTQFRIWATNVLRNYLLKGYVLNQRMDRIENNYENLSNEVKQISLQLKTSYLPNQGIFFNGQIFDAYIFISEIIKNAKTEIILLDNYIDETVLLQLSKRNAGVKATIYTGRISPQLLLDLEKHNKQYPPIEIKSFTNSHDRFIIIDQTELYHIGASLKDLGKKWFAFSRFDSLAESLLKMLNKSC
jgi:hypothetical protein